MNASSNSPSTGRIEAFSDGVFAIVVTLLVLELHVPQIESMTDSALLRSAVIGLAPKFLSFVMSFLFAAVFWAAHHQLFDSIRRSTPGLVWLNTLFLLFLTFIPFPTAMVGEYPENAFSVQFFGVSMLAASLAFALLRWYATIAARLTEGVGPPTGIRAAMLRSLIGPVCYALGAVVSTFATWPALAIYLLIPVFYVIIPIRFYSKHVGAGREKTR